MTVATGLNLLRAAVFGSSLNSVSTHYFVTTTLVPYQSINPKQLFFLIYHSPLISYFPSILHPLRLEIGKGNPLKETSDPLRSIWTLFSYKAWNVRTCHGQGQSTIFPHRHSKECKDVCTLK